jgi:hypothetical protein
LKPIQLGGIELQPEYKMSWNTRFIETNCNEVMQKQSLTFKHHFTTGSRFLNRLFRVALWQDKEEEINRQSDLFKGFFFNPENFAYLKLSLKHRQNKVGNRHSSALLLERACGEDSIKSFKLGFKLGQVSSELVGSHVALNASAELVKGDTLSVIKSKFFIRKTVPLVED